MPRHCLNGRRIGDIETLRNETNAWHTAGNGKPRGVNWQFQIGDARFKRTSLSPKSGAVVNWWSSSVPLSPVFGGEGNGVLMRRLQIRVNWAIGEIANLLRFPLPSVPRLCHPCEAD